jgi:hypothetical protein
MFGRDGDAEGVAFYTDLLTSGAASAADIAARIFDGATGDDATILANKVAVADKYTASVSANADASYTDAAAARTFLSTVTASTDPATVDTDAEVAASQVTVAGQTFTLTSGADSLTLTAGDDTVTAGAGTLGTTDLISDASTDDNDTMNASISATATPTIHNVENINLTWTSNADLAFNASNIKGSTISLTGNALAFSGTATVAGVGSNDLTADSTMTGTLTAQSVVDSNIDAQYATSIAMTTGTATTVGARTTANVTIGKNVAYDNTVEVVNLTSTLEGAKVTLTAGSDEIVDKLVVTGSKSVEVIGTMTGETIVNDLSAGTLKVKMLDAGATNISKVDADRIEIGAAGTTVTVKDNQNVYVKAAAAATLSSFAEATGVSNATVNLESEMGTTAISTLDVSGISTLNLTATKDTTITALTVDAANNVYIDGAGAFSSTVTGTGAIAIDASASTGKVTITNTVGNVATGIKGSATANNSITVAATSATQTLVGGAGTDTFTSANVTGKLTVTGGDGKNTTTANSITSGTLVVNGGSGVDTVSATGLTSGKATVTTGAGDDKLTLGASSTTATEIVFDGGSGTDTLVLGAVDFSAAKVFSLTSVENMTITTGATVSGDLLNGGTYAVKAAAAGAALTVQVVDPNATGAKTTDLSSIAFSTATSSNFSTVTVNGMNNVKDTIKGSTMNDTIDAGTGKDAITISSGGVDSIVIDDTAGDSTLTTTSDKMTSVTGFTAAANSAAKGGDVITFGTAAANTADQTGVTVTSAVTGASAITADSDNGVITIAGASASMVDTLEEWQTVAELVLDSANVAGSVVGFAFDGNFYLVSDGASAGAANHGNDAIVELVGLTGVTSVNTTDGANIVHIA